MNEMESVSGHEPPHETGRRGLGKTIVVCCLRQQDALTRPYRNLTLLTLYFRFRSRIVGATDTQSDWHHPNVLGLGINATAANDMARALLRWLPSRPSSWLATQFPKWALPTKIVLKRAKYGCEIDFGIEVAAYKKLKRLQGPVIPTRYGETEYDGACALLMPYIGGACIADPEVAVLTEPELEPLFHAALSALAAFGIMHDDLKWETFHFIDRCWTIEVMIVDLERVEGASSRKELVLLSLSTF